MPWSGQGFASIGRDRQYGQASRRTSRFARTARLPSAHDQVVAIAVRPLAEQYFAGSSGWKARRTWRFNSTWRMSTWSGSRPGCGTSWTTSSRMPSSTAITSRPRRGSTWDFECRPKGLSSGYRTTAWACPGENDQMFELFYRAAPARAAGLGVGLAVVKLLVETEWRNVDIDSGEGQGSTFVWPARVMIVDDYLL